MSVGGRRHRWTGRIACALACAGAALLTPACALAAEAPAAAREDAFVLMAITIDGVTAYPMKELAPLYADQLTREVGMSDLVRIAQAITDKYRADGYFLSRAVVPPQSGPPGVVRLRVYEGYVGEVDVEGPAAPAVRRLLDGLAGRKPLRLSELDRRLTLANDLPGVRVRPQLEPVLDDPARHRLAVRGDLRRLTGSLYADNRGTESAGPWQVYGRAGLNAAFTAGDQLAFSVLTVPEDPKEFTQGELSYVYPLAGGGHLRGAVSAAEARTNLNGVAGNANRAASLRLSLPLSRGRKHALWAAAALDASHAEQDWLNGAGYEDDLRVLRASLYAERQGDGGSTTGFAQVSRGLDLLGATDRTGGGHSRFDADGQFWKVTVHGSHYRDLSRRTGLYVAADGQWSPDPLLASEEFAAGALPYGRAYNYAELSGERGVAGLVELRLGWDPKRRPLSFFQTYAFADAARVWRLNAAPGYRAASLASAGVGVRLTFNRRATLRIEAAKPLSRTPFARHDKGWRPFISLSAGF